MVQASYIRISSKQCMAVNLVNYFDYLHKLSAVATAHR